MIIAPDAGVKKSTPKRTAKGNALIIITTSPKPRSYIKRLVMPLLLSLHD